MPNWCNNTINISHKEPAMVQRVADAWNSGAFLDSMIPMPYEFKKTLSEVDDYKNRTNQEYWRKFQEAQEKLLLKYFGYKGWYDWRIANWGVKWDVGREGEYNEAVVLDNEVEICFETAWCPPIQAYEKLRKMGYKIEASYYEPGMEFCGTWDDGEDNYIEYGHLEPSKIRACVGATLDDMYNISETAELFAETEEA